MQLLTMPLEDLSPSSYPILYLPVEGEDQSYYVCNNAAPHPSIGQSYYFTTNEERETRRGKGSECSEPNYMLLYRWALIVHITYVITN